MIENKDSENKTVATETEIGSDGVGHSKMLGESGGAQKASPEELQLALDVSQRTIALLQKQIEEMKAAGSQDSSIDKLAAAIAGAISQAQQQKGPAEADNINRATDFKERAIIDGNSLIEAQATMLMYKNEEKEPISIPKSFQAQFGPTLSITVNGVRVAIPVDGKTYKINKTHAIHARERVAKVDRLLSDTEPKVVEIDA